MKSDEMKSRLKGTVIPITTPLTLGKESHFLTGLSLKWVK